MHPTLLPMLKLSCATLFALCTGAALASPDCGMRAAQLLATGKTAELAQLFAQPNASTREQLDSLVQATGPLTALVPAPRALDGKTQRVSVTAPKLPAGYTFEGVWVDARAAKLGPVRLQASVQPGGGCTLLGLHVDAPTAR
jgi:hypothetical protein